MNTECSARRESQTPRALRREITVEMLSACDGREERGPGLTGQSRAERTDGEWNWGCLEPRASAASFHPLGLLLPPVCSWGICRATGRPWRSLSACPTPSPPSHPTARRLFYSACCLLAPLEMWAPILQHQQCESVSESASTTGPDLIGCVSDSFQFVQQMCAPHLRGMRRARRGICHTCPFPPAGPGKCWQ